MKGKVDAAIRTFDNIARRWGLDAHQRSQVLGSAEETPPAEPTLERISHIFAIYRAVHSLLPVEGRADGWMRAVNSAPPFSGRKPIDLIMEGELEAVRDYLRAQLDPGYT